MKPWFLLAILLAASGASSAACAATTGLLSIGPIPLGPKQYVASFDIDTQGVDILAVCHIPFGWKVTAGIDDAVTGRLKGRAGLGPSFVSATSHNLSQLDGLFLISVEKRRTQLDGGLPPTFLGHVGIGRYGRDLGLYRVPIPPASIRLTPAERCPPPSGQAALSPP